MSNVENSFSAVNDNAIKNRQVMEAYFVARREVENSSGNDDEDFVKYFADYEVSLRTGLIEYLGYTQKELDAEFEVWKVEVANL